MKKTMKKLALNKETVRGLANVELSRANGGISSDTLRGTVCMNCTGGGSGGVTCQTSQDSNCDSFGNSCFEGGC